MVAKNHRDVVVTRGAIESDTISSIAAKYWAPFTKETHEKFDVKLIDTIYENEMLKTQFNPKKIMMLEFSQYLEGYLWPNYKPEDSSKAYNLSIVVMVNEKFRERNLDSWSSFTKQPEQFPAFFRKVLELSLDENSLSPSEHCALLTFLVNSFGSVETPIVHNETRKLVSIEIWQGLLPSQREDLFKKQKKLRKIWDNVVKKMSPDNAFHREYLWKLIEKFKKTLQHFDGSEGEEEGEDPVDYIKYCERFIELLIDLESILQTRRFFNSVLHSSHLLTNCLLSPLISTEAGSLFFQLVQLLKFYARFEIDDLSGKQLTHKEVSEQHYKNVTRLQKAAFRFFKENMKEFYLLNVSGVDTRRALQKQFGNMAHEEVYRFAEYLHLVPEFGDDIIEQAKLLSQFSHEYLVETITLHCERRPNQLTQLNEKPLFPTEKVIWDENVVPYESYTGEGVLALDKLNLQFLTLHDYLLRNFNLFQLESTYEIRQDLEDVLFRMKPFQHESRNETVFAGWAKMALPIDHFQITEVAKPLVGEKSPAVVRAVVTVNIGRRQDIRQEWENLRRHDVCFLVACRSKRGAAGLKFDVRRPFAEQIEVLSVRGCDVEGMLDQDGHILEEYTGLEKKARITGDMRKFRLLLDSNQYRLDMEEANKVDLYDTFNLLVRRDSKTNNFKAVLQTIRDLLNTECVVPDWLTDVILGYGEPDSAHYSKLSSAVPELDFNDTFLSFEHVKQSFPGYKVEVVETYDKNIEPVPPFKLCFKELERRQDVEVKPGDLQTIVVTPLVRKKETPYPYSPNKNQVLFTPAQVEAIKSGMQPGLTMVVGPPGTGKTDVAVQIISNIYHNWPNQRTLIVTHSNQALNQLFEKIIALDVDERHLLRMGHGEEALETEKDFSRYGRVNYVLKERIQLLAKVEKLAKALDVVGDVAYTCENAGYFFRFSVFRVWEEFLAQVTAKGAAKLAEGQVAEIFPFKKFFNDLPDLFSGNNSEDMKVAHSCWRHIEQIFEKLDEFRAFELLRNGKDRTEYLLIKEAKIIAMTCTHAALRRNELVKLGFRYDNIVMEEAAQILEVETFIPLLLQNPQDGHNRLKRWIMIGDHHQLPPVVQNQAFQKYSNMEQSLFARLVRLSVPNVQLDRQGRARAQIAELYQWRYKNLGNLPHVDGLPQFQNANAGFAFPFQLIDVPDFNGQGETQPSPHFYQNLGEAEYAVALYTYMRILGYPAEKISILTTYNGQAQLLRDVCQRRCESNPLIGMPGKISTVDKYQGQQNDYVILSLVKTKNIGHIRDVRRLVVALSRARLGLYVLGRAKVFMDCLELTPAMRIFAKYPRKLIILPFEPHPTTRKHNERSQDGEPMEIEDTLHMTHFVHEFYMGNLPAMKAAYDAAMEEYMEAQRILNPPIDETQMEVETEEDKRRREALERKKKQEMDDKKEADIHFEDMDHEMQEPAAPAAPAPVPVPQEPMQQQE
ncbi:unnamed protein product [Caenorhabditis brenneri]